MSYTVFNKKVFDHTKEFMFFGENVGVSRYDTNKYQQIDALTEKTLGFFWRPEEINVSRDAKHFRDLSEHEQRIFVLNLKYQTLLDSMAARSPNVCLLPIVSLPELETWIETWAFSETVHSRSYTHILRGIFSHPEEVLDSIVLDEQIIARAEQVSEHYDNLYKWNCKRQLDTEDYDEFEHKKALYLCLVSINMLEAVRFYVSFACSFSFAERELMNGNADIIKLICRDEAIHFKGTQFILQTMHRGMDDPDMLLVADVCKEDAIKICTEAVEQEKEWADYLFKDGSMQGLNADILKSYIEYIADHRMRSCGFDSPYETTKNPLPWMKNWTDSSNVQTTPQAKEISSYITGGVEGDIEHVDLSEECL